MDYSRAKQTAFRMISQNGLTYQVSRGGGVEIVKGIERQKEEQKFEIKGVRFSYSSFELSNSLIQSGDIKMLAVADDIQVDDRVKIDGKQWRVVNSKPVKPADVVIYYELQLRV